MKYATVWRTVTTREEVDFAIDHDFPEDFWQWEKEDQFEWLDNHAVDQQILSEEYLSIDSIDTVYFDE